MKIILNYFLVLLLLAFSFLACDKIDSKEDNVDNDPYGLSELSSTAVVATGSAADGAVINTGKLVHYYILNGFGCMTLRGSVDLSATSLGSYTLGFVYGLNENITVESCERNVTTKTIENNTFSVDLSGLRSGSSYYYRAYLYIKGNYYYGNIKRFTVFSANADHFVGNYNSSQVDYQVNGGRNQITKMSIPYSISKNGKGLSVDIPIFKFDSSNKITSFESKTFNASVQDGRINISDNKTSIELFFSLLTAESGLLNLKQKTTSGDVSISIACHSDRAR